MALIVKTIGSGARDYATLSAWMATLPAHIDTSGNSYEGDCYNDSNSFTTTSTQLLNLTGHTTDATHTITLTTGPGQSFRDNANVQTNALAYNQANGVGFRATAINYGNAVINIDDANVTFSNIQIQNAGSGVAILTNGAQVIANCIFDSSRFGSINGTVGSNGQATFQNCLIINRGNGAAAARLAGFPSSFYSCTLVAPSGAPSSTQALVFNYSTAAASNCAFFGFAGVFGGSTTFTFTTCMTDVASPPTGVTGSKTYSNQFQNAASDWRLKTGADLIDTGTADSTHGAQDIAKTTRPQGSAYDIGCWELVVAGGAYTASLAETLSLAETPTATMAAAGSLAEALSLAATPAGTMAAAASLSETLVLIDAIAIASAGYAAAITEALTLGDAPIETMAAAGTLGETLALADAVAVAAASFAATITEALTLADVPAGTLAAAAALAETLSLAEAISAAAGGYSASLNEAMAFVDAPFGGMAAQAALNEALTLADLVAITGATYSAALAESFALVDTPTATMASVAALVEALALNDAPAGTLAAAAAIAETLVLTDAPAATMAASRTLSEALALVDALQVPGAYVASIAEVIVPAEVTTGALTATASIHETLNFVDTVAPVTTAPSLRAPRPIFIVTGAADPRVMTWFPETLVHPLPIEIINDGADPGIEGWWPPTRAYPWPVFEVITPPPGVDTWVPPPDTVPVEIITDGTPSGHDGYFPPSRAHPLPVRLVAPMVSGMMVEPEPPPSVFAPPQPPNGGYQRPAPLRLTFEQIQDELRRGAMMMVEGGGMPQRPPRHSKIAIERPKGLGAARLAKWASRAWSRLVPYGEPRL